MAIALSSFLHASALVLAADGRLQTSFSSIAASSNSGAAAIRRAFSLSTGLPFIVPTVQIRRGPVSGVPIERTAGWCAVGCSIHGPGVCFVSIFHSFVCLALTIHSSRRLTARLTSSVRRWAGALFQTGRRTAANSLASWRATYSGCTANMTVGFAVLILFFSLAGSPAQMLVGTAPTALTR